MLESMIRAKTLIQDGEQRDYIPLFQWMKDITLVCDFSGLCRVLTGYYDGKLHLGFTRILDFSEYHLVPPAGIPYLENIDQEKFYRMMNVLLKWAWPIAMITKNENGNIPPVIVHHPEMEETDGGDNDWVKV
ncbi:uncharacterized protein N7473_008740 [Penicillium subrubescens]|uniref:Uncharacterized protein n=1 Tax=Penicillium subrubescens TaxID=1316194 RepID=A0A1Q5UCI2_9EURO|nr:uncharacterized protein N7473_008740 [Penicillium subrubescens]KAJ5886066.1 hypothetical protein N7473_008740 [Penicillium subrubescens]OKP10173.1 hypothetical protein PENSUB_4347 [Penicillium subrubescens]